jgi:acyl-coenzyme A thioesterase PaaI-like protein
MAIWFGEVPLEAVQERSRGTLVEALGIELVARGDDFLTGRIVDEQDRLVCISRITMAVLATPNRY